MTTTVRNAASRRRRGRGLPRSLVAHHEAGHAVVAHVLGLMVVRATIVPGDGYRGAVWHDLAGREPSIIVKYAGPLAAARYLGKPVRFALGRSASSHRPAAVVHCGAGVDLPEAARASGLDKQFSDARERRAYLLWLWERARVLVEQHWVTIEALAAEFLRRNTMTSTQLRRVLARVEGDRDEPAGEGEMPGWLADWPYGE